MTEIARAVALLKVGELVVFPTETVYGLGADARNVAAVEKIFSAKGRPADHPVIVHLPDVSHLDHWAINIPPAAYRLAAVFWPGPLTLILQRHSDVPAAVSGGQASIGLRVPNHPVALALLRAFNDGIAAPSANRFGRISPTTAQHVRDELGDAVQLILDGGACEVGIESTIVDLTSERPQILRPGMVSAEDIASVLGERVDAITVADKKSPRVSGSLEAHYAPRTPLQLCSVTAIAEQMCLAKSSDERIAVLAIDGESPQLDNVIWRTAAADACTFAHDLYSNLRQLDASNCARIVVQQVPTDEAWRAIADRLQRAAVGSGESPR
ncbi:MAG: threonylcarbamoyl-AMP synthase [Rhodocyclaceae bacterium]|nr:threonylcarbamoyl-AMP synthase [Rhodocyclaceae bacterium]